MKILITGNLGFVGSETEKLLRKSGHKIVGYDLMNGKDIRDTQQLKQVFEESAPDRCIHLAAVSRFSDADKDPKKALEVNVIGTKNVVSICKKFHVPLVYASTGSVYMPIRQKPPITEDFNVCGNSVYGCTKYQGELYVLEHDPHIILRYAHLYGREKRMYGLTGAFIDRINRGLSPVLYGGKQSNDFTYIKDVAEANVLAVTAGWDKWNNTYNIGTGEEITARDAGKLICDILSWKKGIEIAPSRDVDPKRFVYDISKAEIMLGFRARYSFKKGLDDMLKSGINSVK
jgi:UDP-glucose 4-epimerase